MAAAVDGRNPAAVDGGNDDGKNAAAFRIDGKNTAAPVDGGNDDGKNPAAFRWIDAARYTVALVVTVLIVSVIVNAIKFVTRSDPLHFSVVGGFVSTARLPPDGVALDLNVRAQNPSGRARMYYVNITGYLFDNKTVASASLDPVYDSMVFGKILDIVVTQQSSVDSSIHVTATNETMPEYFNFLYYGGGHMSDVTLRLDGNLTTEVFSGTKNKTRLTNYYCENLLLGGNKNDEAFKGLPDVICSHDHPNSMTVHIEPMMMIQALWPFVLAIFLAFV